MARMGGTVGVWAMAAALLSHPAAAETGVRLGDDLVLQPYVLLQLDQAGFDGNRGGGQAAGFNPRRLRLGGRLEVSDQLRLGFIWDFGSLPGGDGTLFEASAAFTGLKPLVLTAGVFKTGFSLESMQGAGDYLMLERASIVTVTRNLGAGIRRQGVQLALEGERHNASVALTAGQAGPGRDGDQRALVARVAGLAVHTDTLALHLGASGQYVVRAASSPGQPPGLSLSDQTELAVDNTDPALSTGRIRARTAGVLGPEFGLAWNRLWLQAEYYAVSVNRQIAAGGGTLRFDGWYAQAAYTLLGTPRRWQPATAAWSSPKPGDSPGGALELGVRHSVVDLDSRDVRGGRQHVTSLGLNWWPREPLRLSALLEHAEVTGTPAARRVDAAAVRAQLQF